MFAAAEWLRGHVLTGYPWDLAAYVWSGSDAMMNSAAAAPGVTLRAMIQNDLPDEIDLRGHHPQPVFFPRLAAPIGVTTPYTAASRLGPTR